MYTVFINDNVHVMKLEASDTEHLVIDTFQQPKERCFKHYY